MLITIKFTLGPSPPSPFALLDANFGESSFFMICESSQQKNHPNERINIRTFLSHEGSNNECTSTKDESVSVTRRIWRFDKLLCGSFGASDGLFDFTTTVLLDVDVDVAVVTRAVLLKDLDGLRTTSLLVGKRRLPLARSEREGCRADENMSSRLSLSSRGEKMSTFFQFHFPKNLTSLPDDAGFFETSSQSATTRFDSTSSSSSSSRCVSSDWRGFRNNKYRSIMSIRGTFQLSKLSFFHCPHTGSSKGLNAFLSNVFPSLEKHCSQTRGASLVLDVTQRRGQDPYLRAEFLNGREKTIGLKNKTEEEVAVLVNNAMSEKGRVVKKVPRRVMRTRITSVQGAWQPSVTSGGGGAKRESSL